MTTRRRLLTAVALGTLVAAGLAGCRSEPSVAAYVGSTQITHDQIDSYYNDVQAKTAAAAAAQAAAASQPPPTAGPAQSPVTRRDIVLALVARELSRESANARSLQPVPVTAEQAAQFLRVPADTEYARVYAEYQGYLEALIQDSDATTPTEADLQGVLDRMVDGGLQAAGTSLEQFRANIGPGNLSLVGRVAQVRNDLVAQAGRAGVAVNPRYAPAELTLLAIPDARDEPYPLMVAPLNASNPSPAVLDQP